MRGAAAVGEIMHRRVIVAIRRGGEIERLAEAVAFQLKLVSVLEHQHRRHDGVNILGLAINQHTLAALETDFKVRVSACRCLTIDGAATSIALSSDGLRWKPPRANRHRKRAYV